MNRGFDVFQLIHELFINMQSPGCIDEDRIAQKGIGLLMASWAIVTGETSLPMEKTGMSSSFPMTSSWVMAAGR